MSHHAEIWKTVRWISVLAALIILAFIALGLVQRSMQSTSSGIERGLDKVLQALTNSDTRIVEGRAEVVEQNEISELALLELKMNATRRFENEGFVLKYLSTGTKQLILRGHYRVTAGYRLEPGVSLRINDGVPTATFPEPEILSVELIDFETLNEKDGWFNQVTPQDRSKLLRELRQQMRKEAEKSGILDIVEATMKTRMSDLLDVQEVKIERHDP